MRMLSVLRVVIELTVMGMMIALAVTAYLKRDAILEYCSALIKSDEAQASPEVLVEKNLLPDDTSAALRSINNLRVAPQLASEDSSQEPMLSTAKPFKYQKVKYHERIIVNRQTNKYITKDIIAVTVPASVKLNSAVYQQRMDATREKIQTEYGPIMIKVRHPSVKGYVGEQEPQ